MAARTCEIHQEYCPTGECRRCEPAPNPRAIVVVNVSPGATQKLRDAMACWRPLAIIDGSEEIAGVVDPAPSGKIGDIRTVRINTNGVAVRFGPSVYERVGLDVLVMGQSPESSWVWSRQDEELLGRLFPNALLTFDV